MLCSYSKSGSHGGHASDRQRAKMEQVNQPQKKTKACPGASLARPPERRCQSKRLRHAVEASLAIVLAILACIEHIETTNPEQHRSG